MSPTSGRCCCCCCCCCLCLCLCLWCSCLCPCVFAPFLSLCVCCWLCGSCCCPPAWLFAIASRDDYERLYPPLIIIIIINYYYKSSSSNNNNNNSYWFVNCRPPQRLPHSPTACQQWDDSDVTEHGTPQTALADQCLRGRRRSAVTLVQGGHCRLPLGHAKGPRRRATLQIPLGPISGAATSWQKA